MNKILLVDDEPSIIMALEYAFRKVQYDVFIARDGEEALNILEEETPNIIVLDIMMPKVDGYATLEAIKKNDNLKNTKVIFLSAKKKEADIEKGLKLGADAYMSKPFSIKKLMGKVNELLDE